MTLDPTFPFESASGDATALSPGVRERFGRWRDRAEVTGRDAARWARERGAMAAGVARTQVGRGPEFVAYHARRRPLLTTGLAASAGILLGVLLAARGRSR